MEKMLKDLTLEEANAICNGLILDYPDDACSMCPIRDVVCKWRVDDSANIPGEWLFNDQKLPSSVIDEYKNKLKVAFDKEVRAIEENIEETA